MSLILSVVLIIVIIMIYMLMIQIFTVLFRITGLTKDKARFQVISLLTNSGFSTKESELITSNHSRRKIAIFTMIIGTIFNVLIVSLLINILFNIKLDSESESLKYLGISICAFILLLIIVRLPLFRRTTERLIERVATKIKLKNHSENVITELDAYGNNSIVEIYIADMPHDLAGKSIYEAELKSRYNITILLIQRNNRVLDVKKDTILQKEDKLVVFGKLTNIEELFKVSHHEEVIDESKVNNLSIIDNYGSNAMMEVEVKNLPIELVDKTLKESQIKEKYGITIMMKNNDNVALLVDRDTVINEGDKIVLFGPYEHIKNLFSISDENPNT